MPRKRCCGQIDEYPVCQRFESIQSLHDNVMKLGFEEIEAIRLKDMEGFDQDECARRMSLTRPTFQRLLVAARKKLAIALVEGQTIEIEGGHYQMANRTFECTDCQHIWEEPSCTEGGKHGFEIACPACGSMKKSKLNNGVRHACGGAGHDHSHDHDHDHGSAGGCCSGNYIFKLK
jgi:predicted DNA-binding protein (UPF0251 family)